MKKLIVYLSPIEKAQNIIEYSIRLAQHLQLDIHYVCNIDIEKSAKNKDEDISKEELSRHLIEAKKKEIEQLLEKDEWDWDGVDAAYSIFSGSLKEVFKSSSLKKKGKLVLFPVEVENKSKVKSINQILKSIKLPVWCFKVDKEYRPVKTVVYGTDYKKTDISVIKSFGWFARAFDAKVNLLHIYKKGKFRQQLIDAGLKDLIDKKIEYPEVEIHSKKKRSVVKGISRFCEKSFADLVILLKKDKYFFQGLLGSSTIGKSLEKLDLPILIYKK
jgi:hypothetical protein